MKNKYNYYKSRCVFDKELYLISMDNPTKLNDFHILHLPAQSRNWKSLFAFTIVIKYFCRKEMLPLWEFYLSKMAMFTSLAKYPSCVQMPGFSTCKIQIPATFHSRYSRMRT